MSPRRFVPLYVISGLLLLASAFFLGRSTKEPQLSGDVVCLPKAEYQRMADSAAMWEKLNKNLSRATQPEPASLEILGNPFRYESGTKPATMPAPATQPTKGEIDKLLQEEFNTFLPTDGSSTRPITAPVVRMKKIRVLTVKDEPTLEFPSIYDEADVQRLLVCEFGFPSDATKHHYVPDLSPQPATRTIPTRTAYYMKYMQWRPIKVKTARSDQPNEVFVPYATDHSEVDEILDKVYGRLPNGRRHDWE